MIYLSGDGQNLRDMQISFQATTEQVYEHHWEDLGLDQMRAVAEDENDCEYWVDQGLHDDPHEVCGRDRSPEEGSFNPEADSPIALNRVLHAATLKHITSQIDERGIQTFRARQNEGF